MLEIPANARTVEFPTSTIWLDEEGILWSQSKKGPSQTLEQSKEAVAVLAELLKGKKVCMLLDITHATESSREVREFAARELPKITEAMALVSDSALGKMIANLFFQLKPQPYPTKMFNNVNEALTWLRKYQRIPTLNGAAK
jgi:hypothetical protein